MPSKKQKEKILKDFADKLLPSQKDIPEDIAQIVNENFKELLWEDKPKDSSTGLYQQMGKFGIEIYVEDKNLGGYTSFFKEFPNIISQGETILEAQDNLWKTAHDVLKYFLDKDKKGSIDQ